MQDFKRYIFINLISSGGIGLLLGTELLIREYKMMVVGILIFQDYFFLVFHLFTITDACILLYVSSW